MRNDNIYPKNNDELIRAIQTSIQKNSMDINTKIYASELEKWLQWYNTLDLDKEYQLENNQFLKPYYEFKLGHLALQVWNKGKEVDNIAYNLIANYHNEFNTEKTNLII